MTEIKCTRCRRVSMIFVTFQAGDTPFYLCADCVADFERFLSGYVVSEMIKIGKEVKE